MTDHRGDGPLVRYLRGSHPELRIIERAIKGGWDISDGKRAEIVDELMAMARSSNTNLAIKALRLLKEAHADDRRYEISILQILQTDQQGTPPSMGAVLDGKLAAITKQIETASTDQVHEIMERLSEPAEESEED